MTVFKCNQVSDGHVLQYKRIGLYDLKDSPSDTTIVIGSLGHGS